MKYAKATDYALHIVEAMAAQENPENVSVQTLSARLQVSQAYLSKILTQLVKAGLIRSAPGVKGGYRLLRPREEITFLDVIRAVEGSGPLYETALPHESPCRISAVMQEAEAQMNAFLAARRLSELSPAAAGETEEPRRRTQAKLKPALL